MIIGLSKDGTSRRYPCWSAIPKDEYFSYSWRDNEERNHVVMTTKPQDEIGQLDTTVEEWKEALEVKDDEGQTIDEISVATGVSETTTRRKLYELIKEGKCIRGRRGRFNVYQLTGEEK